MKHLVLSSKQMKAMDVSCIEDFGVPSRVLMEVAGARCADFILKEMAEHLSGLVLILCGSGNNGGDGYVVARQLNEHCRNLLILRYGTTKISPETEANMLLCQKLHIPIIDVNKDTLEYFAQDSLHQISLIVDAMYGIGFKGALPKHVCDSFEVLGRSSAKIVAIDIPSGIEADTGCGTSLKADVTLCIEHLKYGNLLGNGRWHCGKLHIIPIGIPTDLKIDINSLLIDEATAMLPLRMPDAFKGTYGKVMLFGGSIGYLGSIALSARAALRSGAGLVYLYSRKETQAFYSVNPAEIMFNPIAEDPTSKLPLIEHIVNAVESASSIVIGPGLGTDKYAKLILGCIMKHSKVPTVIDADAITLISKSTALMKYLRKPNFVLTPHPGEFCRIAKLEMLDLQSDPIGELKAFVQKHHARVLLKGASSVYMDSDSTFISTAGNDGLSTGGSGDVLAGIIASFAAQGMDIDLAAINASYQMGSTAEKLARIRKTPSIIPSDIIENLFLEEHCTNSPN